MHRRDFLHPRHIAGVAGAALDLITEEQSTEEIPDFPLLNLSCRAMATNFEAFFPFGMPGALEAGNAAFALIDTLEEQMTVYRDSSEVSNINRLAAMAPVQVEPQLFELFQLSHHLYEQTHGAFDITAGALIKAWGFFKGPPRIPSRSEREQVLEKVGMQHVTLCPQRRTIHFARRGMEINLGSIGKGHALDRAVACLRAEWEMPSVLIQGGHSSAIAVGDQPGDSRGWAVGIRHPWREERLGIVYLKNRALATSAATFKHLSLHGRKLGHILDPRTGWPAEGVGTVTVLAPTAALADALATSFYILGIDRARDYCAQHPEIAAIILPAEDQPPVLLGSLPIDIEWTK